MRAGPLSDPKVIALLNRAFVPVYVSNEDYEGGGVPPDEKKAYQRIYHEALQEKRSAGSVCVYLLAPDGKGFDSIIVSKAAEPGVLQKRLAAAVERFKPGEGKTLVAPAAQSVPPRGVPGSLVLHLVARVDHRYSWGEFPSENWIVLQPADLAKLSPPMDVKPGDAISLDKDVVAKVLTYFYPQTETCNASHDVSEKGSHRHRIEQLALAGKVVSVEGSKVRVRIDGRQRLKHTFYPGRDDDNVAAATVVGYLDFDRATKKVSALRLVTETATYGRFGFTVAVQPAE